MSYQAISDDGHHHHQKSSYVVTEKSVVKCDVDCCDVVLIVLAIFLPPLAVALKLCCCDVWGCLNLILNILLCILGWVPAVVHAWIVICFTTETQAVVYYNNH